MSRIGIGEARQLWERAVRQKGWQDRKIARVMFDYDVVTDGPSNYSPAPAWPTVALPNGTAERSDYDLLQETILTQGVRYSRLGSARRTVSSRAECKLQPLPITREVVVRTIQEVMRAADPRVVTQEQILRAAFIAHLPEEQRVAIGRPSAAVHLERPIPSKYQYTGTKPGTARYDLAFGHSTETSGIVGVAELKAGAFSFDGMGSRIDAALARTEPGQGRGEPVTVDVLRLLDPALPSRAFRVSWIAMARRGAASGDRTAQLVQKLFDHAGRQRGLRVEKLERDDTAGWWCCTMSGVRIELAWYQPAEGHPDRFELL